MHPHIYVINLRRRTDRHELFLRNWEAAGLSKEQLTWVEAVDGRTLPDAAFADFKGVSKIRTKLAGQLGCYLSHVNAIQKAIENEHFPILILEDDAVVMGPVNLSAMVTNMPENAHLLYVGGLPVKGRSRAKDYVTGDGYQPLPVDIRMYGGHAYIVPNKAAAQQLLAHLHKNPLCPDLSLVRYQRTHRQHVYVHSPFLFYQAESMSDIEGVVRWS